MNSDWQAWLAEQGATFINQNGIDTVASFSEENTHKENSVAMYDLSYLGLLKISGADRKTFLQNLTSNDVNQVSSTTAQLNSHCSAKGRMLLSFVLFEKEDDYYLLMPAPLVDDTLQRLKKYIFMSKVSMDNASDELITFGLHGSDTTTLLEQTLQLKQPEQSMQVTSNENGICIQMFGSPDRYVVVTQIETAKHAWNSASAMTSDHWKALEIQAGVPIIYPETQEQWVPQTINFQLVGGINFEKGCYPGQEIVARMHYLGQIKRRMYLLTMEEETSLQPGDSVFSSTHSEPIGSIIDAVGNTALASLMLKHAEDNSAAISVNDTVKCTVSPPPYGFD